MWSLLFVILENICSLYWKSGTMGSGVYVAPKAEAEILKGRPGKQRKIEILATSLKQLAKTFSEASSIVVLFSNKY